MSRKRNTDSYKSYILKVLNEIHPDIGISKKAIDTMDDIVHDLFNRIASEAGMLARYTKKKTITSREIQTAVKLVLPPYLSRYAISEGKKAVLKINVY